MTKMERCRVAMEYHEKGFNCAQSVLEAFRDLVGLTQEQCLGVATGLGGGFRISGGNILQDDPALAVGEGKGLFDTEGYGKAIGTAGIDQGLGSFGQGFCFVLLKNNTIGFREIEIGENHLVKA